LQDPPPDVAIVGDPEEWQSRWGAIAALRGRADILFLGCSIAEFRALSRSRQLPPPLAPDPRLGWLLRDDGSVGRARLPDQARAADNSV
jgi:S-DNA-T family DNA segregation ATPase FtsK/SpoIIIE